MGGLRCSASCAFPRHEPLWSVTANPAPIGVEALCAKRVGFLLSGCFTGRVALRYLVQSSAVAIAVFVCDWFIYKEIFNYFAFLCSLMVEFFEWLNFGILFGILV